MSENESGKKKREVTVEGNLIKARNVTISNGDTISRTWSETIAYTVDLVGVSRDDLIVLAADSIIIKVAARYRKNGQLATKGLNRQLVKWTEFMAEARKREAAPASLHGELYLKKAEAEKIDLSELEEMEKKLAELIEKRRAELSE
jgi:hypothetical protein